MDVMDDVTVVINVVYENGWKLPKKRWNAHDKLRALLDYLCNFGGWNIPIDRVALQIHEMTLPAHDYDIVELGTFSTTGETTTIVAKTNWNWCDDKDSDCRLFVWTKEHEEIPIGINSLVDDRKSIEKKIIFATNNGSAGEWTPAFDAPPVWRVGNTSLTTGSVWSQRVLYFPYRSISLRVPLGNHTICVSPHCTIDKFLILIEAQSPEKQHKLIIRGIEGYKTIAQCGFKDQDKIWSVVRSSLTRIVTFIRKNGWSCTMRVNGKVWEDVAKVELCARYGLTSIEFSTINKDRDIYIIDAAISNDALKTVSIVFRNTKISVPDWSSQSHVADLIFFETGVWCREFMVPFDDRWKENHIVETRDSKPTAVVKVSILNSTCEDITFFAVDWLSTSCLEDLAWKIFDKTGLPVVWQRHMWFQSLCKVSVFLVLPAPPPSIFMTIDATEIELCRNTIGALEQLSRNNPHRAVHYVSNMEGALIDAIRFMASRTDATCHVFKSNYINFTPRAKKLLNDVFGDARLAGCRDSVDALKALLDVDCRPSSSLQDSRNDYFKYLSLDIEEETSFYRVFSLLSRLNCWRAKLALVSFALNAKFTEDDRFDMVWRMLQSETNPAITCCDYFQDMIATCVYFGIGCKADPDTARKLIRQPHINYSNSYMCLSLFMSTMMGHPCSIGFDDLTYTIDGVDDGKNAMYLVAVKPSELLKFEKALNSPEIHLENHGIVLELSFGTSEDPKFTPMKRKTRLVHCTNRYKALKRCADWSREDRALLSFASDTENCSICFESVATDILFVQCEECGNMIHKACFVEWARRSNTCTQCRQPIRT